ncbi:MAG: GNAT family N-acetyltransferase [Flavobacterium sp.]
MKINYIETPRFTLRIVTPEVYNHAMEDLGDVELMEFFGLDEAGLAKQKSRQAGGLTTFNKSFVNFYPIDKATGKVIGWCGYHTWYTDHNRAEVGYHLNADESKRKGYMTEILAAVLRYGFDVMNLHRVEALTATYNVASIKTLEKFGFTHEGTLREHYLVDGKHEDSPIFSLLRHEFNPEK